MINRLSLALIAFWPGIAAAAALAAEPLVPVDSAAPAIAPVSAPAPVEGLRPSPTTPHPLDSLPIVPDPVRFGGFHPKPPAPPSSFLAEGAFIYQRHAIFSVDVEGKAVLQFDPDPRLGKDAKPPPPVYVLPNLKRMAIEDAIKGRTLPLTVSGTATEYDSHNYLLLDDETHPAGPAMTPAPTPQPAARPTTAPKNLSADEMLGQLLRTGPGSAVAKPPPLRWDQAPGTDKTSGKGAAIPGAPGVTLIREGRYIADRLGRLKRDPGGKTLEFVFDSDGRTLHDPPMILMPCVKVAQMQGAEQGNDEDLHFRVSGTVSEYRGRNYILPEKVVSVAAAALIF